MEVKAPRAPFVLLVGHTSAVRVSAAILTYDTTRNYSVFRYHMYEYDFDCYVIDLRRWHG